MKREQQKNHRATCATRLVQFDADSGEPFNCGLPCDCDNPQRWVEVPVGDATPPAPGEDARLKEGMQSLICHWRNMAERQREDAEYGRAIVSDGCADDLERLLRGTTPTPGAKAADV